MTQKVDIKEIEKKYTRHIFPTGWRTKYYKNFPATPKHPDLDTSHKDSFKGLVKLTGNQGKSLRDRKGKDKVYTTEVDEHTETGIVLDVKSAIYSLGAKISLVPCFHQVLLELARLNVYILSLVPFSASKAELSSYDRDHMTHKDENTTQSLMEKVF